MGCERLETRNLLAAAPFGALPDDTGEYMLGDVRVTVVLMESEGAESTEDWSQGAIEAVKTKVRDGLEWWTDTLSTISSVAKLDFKLDFTHADTPVKTRYEPISRSSNDYTLWVNEFLDFVGYNEDFSNISADIRRFNHAQRVASDSDWAFTMFVVNDENDADGMFDTSKGGFGQAFAFSGGRFFVSPAGRPASTFAHEAAHMFWARDEYPGGGKYQDRRGYYDTQNTNAWDNPTPGFVQQDSLMADGLEFSNAWNQHISSTSSLEMLGWRDSDADGLFDVLDVPHELHGRGYFDATTRNYRFTGTSSVGTFPNQNSSGLQNDITLNRISRAQYRVDGGPWQTAATYDAYTADLDLTIGPLASGFHDVEIRTVDDATYDTKTGTYLVSSPIFHGTTDAPAATLQPGINGFVWNDVDADGEWDSGEGGLAGWTVQLVDGSGQTLQLQETLEPDNYAQGTELNTVVSGVTLTAIGSDAGGTSVTARDRTTTSTGSRVFHHLTQQGGGWSADWTSSSRMLRMDFTQPVSTLSIDAVSDKAIEFGRLEIYDSTGNLLDRYTTDGLSSGSVETMTLSRPTADIAYAIARGHLGTAIGLDNLRFGPSATTTTDTHGAYSLASLAAGTYRVQVEGPSNWVATAPLSGEQTVTIGAGESLGNVDFGQNHPGAAWQNPSNRHDVSGDGLVTPVDALMVINDLNANGSRQLPPVSGQNAPPPYLDVSGDNYLSPVDALHVINVLNSPASNEPAKQQLVSAAAVPAPVVSNGVEGELAGISSEQKAPDSGVRSLHSHAADAAFATFDIHSRNHSSGLDERSEREGGRQAAGRLTVAERPGVSTAGLDAVGLLTTTTARTRTSLLNRAAPTVRVELLEPLLDQLALDSLRG